MSDAPAMAGAFGPVSQISLCHAGMILFIPEEDRVQFTKFIKSLNLPPES